MNRNCKRYNQTVPVRYKIYDGTISYGCRACKAKTLRVFLKGQILFATVIPVVINNGGGGFIPVVI